MQGLLMLHIDKEASRLNQYGSLLISIHGFGNSYTDSLFKGLVVEFDNVSDKLSNLAVAIIKCNGNKELLDCCVEYVNELSFTVMNFIIRVKEYENILKN